MDKEKQVIEMAKEITSLFDSDRQIRVNVECLNCGEYCEECEYYEKNKKGFFDCVGYAVGETLYNANCRIIADDEIVIKKSEYQALKKDYDEWKDEYDHNCLLRLEVFELEKQLEKAKQETRDILQKVKDILQGDYNIPLPLAQLYQENGIYYGGKI